MKLDVLAIGAHPDDVELSCAGTLLMMIAKGRKAGVLDLTQGELGTRGSGPLRLQEAEKAAEIMKLDVRENLGIPDAFFRNTPENQLRVIEVIRRYRPEIILCNAIHDRHPDHARAAELVSESCFYSGLSRIETKSGGEVQQAWRPKAVYHYLQDRWIKPDVIVDVTDAVDKKMESILAYSSQFFTPDSKEPVTPISTKEFLEFVRNRMAVFGREAGFPYAEAFTVERTPGLKDLFDLY